MNLPKANVILGALAVVLAVPTYLQLRSEGGAFTDVGSIPLMFDGFTAENVGRVLLAKPKPDQPKADPARPDAKPQVVYDQLLLVRTDKGYKVGAVPGMAKPELAEAPVGRERVESEVFAHLRRIRSDKETLVRADATPEQLVEYGLDDAQAFLIRVDDAAGKSAVAELLVGKASDEGRQGTEAVRGVYVRRVGSNDVVLYEFEQDVKLWLRDADPANWIDKLLFRLEPAQLRRFVVRNTAGGAQPFEFAKADGKASWAAAPAPQGPGYENLGAVRQTELETMVQRLRYVAAQDFRLPVQRAGNLATLGLQPARIELQAAWEEGGRPRTVTLQIGDKVDGKNEYYLLCSESQFLMTWPASLVAPFERDPRELFDPAAAPKAPDAPGEPGPGGDKGGK
jgi:hypothetical protein